ncbi:MAG: hypothetical protein DMF98_00985 [Acidobacteria bacterium]|nr:MAG: hypothetical protein DMF98_00985 [Acidobacteriota bacterium]
MSASLKPLTKLTVACLAVIFAVAVGFRLWLLHAYRPGAPWVAGLTLADAEMGRNLLAGRGWVANADMVDRAARAQENRPSMVDLEELLPVDDEKPGVIVYPGSAHSAGYSVWFAISYWLGGHLRYAYSQRMQALLDAAGCLFVFGIGRRLWSSAAGLVGAALYAVSPAHAFLANLTVAASTDSFWFLATSYGAVGAWDRLRDGGRPWGAALLIAGAAFCGAAMNSTSITLPLVVTAAAIAAAVLDGRALRLVPYFLAAQVLVYLVLTPWAMRNSRMFGQFSFVRGGFWQLAYASFGELPNPWGLGFDDKYYWNWIEENCTGCNAGQQAATTRDFILYSVVPSPGFTRHLTNLVELRLPRLLSVAQVSASGIYTPSDPPEARETLRKWLGIADAALPVVAVFVFIGIGVVLTRRAAATAAVLAVAPSAFLIAFSLVFYVELRKTVPAYGCLFAFAAIGIVEPTRRLALLLTRRRAVVAACGLAAALHSPRSDAAVMAAGQMHSVVLKPDGTVWSWGSASLGQLGDGVTDHTTADSAPAKNLFDAIAVAAGGNHTLALRKDGTVWAWGDNLWGELGDGSRTSRDVPTQVPGLGHIVAIAAGYIHSMALANDGSLWAWGDNHYGQIGSGATSVSLKPIRVQGLPTATTITAGFFHSAAVDRAGHVWTWGDDKHGQLGDGLRQPRAIPVDVMPAGDAAAVAAGQFHTLVLRSDGTVWTCGGNTFGQLGRDPMTASSSGHPDELTLAVVPGLHGVTMVAAGEDHSVALTGDGQVWTWGDNLYGQLGDGTWDVRRRPVRAALVGSVTAIASGHAHVLALKSDGTIFTWGFGSDGQLGDNTSTRRVARPRTIAALSLVPGPRFDAPSFHSVGRAETAWAAPIVQFKDGSFFVKGKAESPTAYVIMASPSRAGPDQDRQVLVATGVLNDGCVTVGVQERNQWIFYKNFNRHGPFTLRWPPPTTGEYVIVIAHCLPDDRPDNDFQITHLGWLGI